MRREDHPHAPVTIKPRELALQTLQAGKSQTKFWLQAERRASSQGSQDLGRAGTPEAEVSADVAAPSVQGLRHKVPLLNLSTESLRMSVEAITPPCSFPLRGEVS